MVGIVRPAPGIVGALCSISFLKIGSAEKLQPIAGTLKGGSQIHTKPSGLRVATLARQVDCRLVGPFTGFPNLRGASLAGHPSLFDSLDGSGQIAVVSGDG